MAGRGASTYALVTPARDEHANLQRLSACLLAQSLPPSRWVVVDNGSSDGTVEFVADLAAEHEWIELLSSPPASSPRPGRPIVAAFHAGVAALSPVDVVVKLDADVSMDEDYFERLLAAFAGDERLGIASGQCYELEGGAWAPTHVTGDHVRGATRAWRWECLQAVLPLDDTVPCVMDLVDELKAATLGWRTGIVPGLRFYHHRSVGERDGGSRVRWSRQGQGAYYVGYRFWYLLARSAFRATRQPAAAAMVSGYLGAWLRGQKRCEDAAVVAQLRRQQNILRLPARAREALGRRPREVETV